MKKKKKKRVVHDIEVIGAEFEEKERILAERAARARNPQGGFETDDEDGSVSGSVTGSVTGSDAGSVRGGGGIPFAPPSFNKAINSGRASPGPAAAPSAAPVAVVRQPSAAARAASRAASPAPRSASPAPAAAGPTIVAPTAQLPQARPSNFAPAPAAAAIAPAPISVPVETAPRKPIKIEASIPVAAPEPVVAPIAPAQTNGSSSPPLAAAVVPAVAPAKAKAAAEPVEPSPMAAPVAVVAPLVVAAPAPVAVAPVVVAAAPTPAAVVAAPPVAAVAAAPIAFAPLVRTVRHDAPAPAVAATSSASFHSMYAGSTLQQPPDVLSKREASNSGPSSDSENDEPRSPEVVLPQPQQPLPQQPPAARSPVSPERRSRNAAVAPSTPVTATAAPSSVPPSPAVTDADLRALNRSTLAGEDAPDRILDEQSKREKKGSKAVYPKTLANGSTLPADDEPGAAANGSAFTRAASLPRGGNSLLSSAITIQPSADSSATSAHNQRSKSLLVDSTDEFDVRVNQLSSSPGAQTAVGRGRPHGEMASNPPSARGASPRRAPLQQPQQVGTPSSRPQLASTGMSYNSNHFDAAAAEPGAFSAAPSAASSAASTPSSLPRRSALSAAIETKVAQAESDDAMFGLEPQGVAIKFLIRPVTREPDKDLMRKQNSKCANCSAALVAGIWSKPRYCHYTGMLYCATCHVNALRVIPGRVLVHGDIKPYKVCELAKSYLDTLYSMPTIPAAAISPTLYQSCRDLRCVFVLRQQLCHIRAFIFTCKKKENLLKLFSQRQYMLNDTLQRATAGDTTPPKTAPPPARDMMGQSVSSDVMPHIGIDAATTRASLLASSPHPHQHRPQFAMSPPSPSPMAGRGGAAGSSRARSTGAGTEDESASASSSSGGPKDSFDATIDDPILNPTLRDMYSLRDLVEIIDGSLYPRLTAVVRQIMAHIIGGRCEICLSKAFFCEVPGCPQPQQPIYSFQLNTVIQCPVCAQSFHRSCFDPLACPKCLRVANRKLVQQNKIALIKASQGGGGVGRKIGAGQPFVGTGSPMMGGGGAPPGSYASSAMNIGGGVGTPQQTPRLGFAPTGTDGGPMSSRASSRRSAAAAQDIGETVDRTRSSGSRGSSPARKLNARLAGGSTTPRGADGMRRSNFES